MPFVKLHCGILDSSLWVDRDAREIFITALLMAKPEGFNEELAQLDVNTMETTGFVIPPGVYGFIPASGPGIVRRAGLENSAGLAALVRLGSPENDSRSADFGGRRLIRVDGGYVVLNYMKYREMDTTAAERQARYRAKKVPKKNRHAVTSSRNAVTSRNVTQAEAEAEAEVLGTDESTVAPLGHAPNGERELMFAAKPEMEPGAADLLEGTLSHKELVRNGGPPRGEAELWASRIGLPMSEMEGWYAHYCSNGWVVGRARSPVKSWKGTMVTWKKNWETNRQAQRSRGNGFGQRVDVRTPEETTVQEMRRLAAQARTL